MRYRRETLVKGVAHLARVNSVISIGGREVHNLAWSLSTTMRENSVPVG